MLDSLPENIDDEVTGFVVPCRDAHAIAKKLECLNNDVELRHEMGAAGRRRAIEKFNISDQIKAFDQFYRQVLGETH